MRADPWHSSAAMEGGGVMAHTSNQYIEVVLRTTRTTQWALAKGHLHAMLETFWQNQYNESKPNQFDVLKGRIDDFIRNVEEDGLQE